MSEAKFTPGPWTLRKGFSDWGLPCQHDLVIGEGETERDQIAGVPSITPYCMGARQADREYAARQYANARLISAAPEMYEALKGVLPFMEAAEKAGLVGDEGCFWPVESVRAALAKAEGRS